MLDLFIDDRFLWDNTGRTKQYVIKMLCEIANIRTDKLKSSDLITHCKAVFQRGTKPQTINHDVSYLRAVMKKSMPVFNIKSNVKVFDDAVPVLLDMKLIGRSGLYE